MTVTATPGWAFLIGRGREMGYQVLLTPDFMADSGDSGVLIAAVKGEVPDDGLPEILNVVAPRAGPLCIVYRTHRATHADVGLTDKKEAPLLDGAGRPLVLAFGFVCRSARVDRVNEEDLKAAWEPALRAYQHFHTAEVSFTSEISHPYSLRSITAPIQKEEVESHTSQPPESWNPPSQKEQAESHTSRSPEPWSPSAFEPKRRSRPRPSSRRKRGPSALWLAVIVFMFAALGTGVWLVTYTPEVTVPDVVGLTQEDARQRLSEIELNPVIEQREPKGPCQRDIVTDQSPDQGAVVRKPSQVTLTVCGGPLKR